MTESFFDDVMGRGGVPRDGHGNALILPRGATGDRLVPYTSASGLADYIEDHSHIHRWEMRYLAKGMGQSPDLCELAAAEQYSTGFDAVLQGRDKTASGRRLDAIIERAHDRVGIHQKADYGTAVHAWTEPGNNEPISDRARADVEAFHDCVKRNGIRIVATEIFTANDEVRSAGTFDHLCWVPGYGFVICDKKTGKMDFHHFGVQLSVYANADIYDPATRQRRQLEELCDHELNTDTGIVFAIKDGRCELKEVDLRVGYEGARAAARARDYLDSNGMGGDAETFVQRALKEQRRLLALQLTETTTREERLALWRANQHLWTDDHTKLAEEAA